MTNDLWSIYERWIEDVELDILLTKRCNLNCIHCFLDNKKDEMTLELIKKIANDDLFLLHSQKKKRTVNLSGGEIFMRKDIGEIVSMFGDLNVSAGCVSNGFYISDEIIGLLEKHSIGLSLSIDGVGEIHNYYRKNKDSFDRLESVIERLQKSKVQFGVICSVSRINKECIEEIIKYCIHKKVRSIRFQIVKPEGNAIAMRDANLILDDKEKQDLFEELLHYCGKYVADINITGYGTFKSELREHGCKFGLKWGKTCHSNSTPWPKSFGIDTDGSIIQIHPFHNNSFWKIGHVDEGIFNVIRRYYASDKHIKLLDTLKETYEENILKSSEEFIFEDLYLENKVAEKILSLGIGGND